MGEGEEQFHPFVNEPTFTTKAPGMKESSQGPMLTVSMTSFRLKGQEAPNPVGDS